MATITAAEVQKLRILTGAGMMDCKKALIENDGDFQKAIDYLRKKGQKVASKRAEREANEGMVMAKVTPDRKFGVVIMINCETDFVAKTQQFTDFVKKCVEKALVNQPGNIEEFKAMDFNGRTVLENLTDLTGKTGEKLEISHYDIIQAPVVFEYNHIGNRLGTIVGFNKSDATHIDEVGHEVAMQIAAMNPVAIDKDDVDPSIIEQEIEIGKEQARQEGKPEELLEKIAMGKLNKFYMESTLLNQAFVRDTKKTVRQYLLEHDKDLKVTVFYRLMLGA